MNLSSSDIFYQMENSVTALFNSLESVSIDGVSIHKPYKILSLTTPVVDVEVFHRIVSVLTDGSLYFDEGYCFDYEDRLMYEVETCFTDSDCRKWDFSQAITVKDWVRRFRRRVLQERNFPKLRRYNALKDADTKAVLEAFVHLVNKELASGSVNYHDLSYDLFMLMLKSNTSFLASVLQRAHYVYSHIRVSRLEEGIEDSLLDFFVKKVEYMYGETETPEKDMREQFVEAVNSLALAFICSGRTSIWYNTAMRVDE